MNNKKITLSLLVVSFLLIGIASANLLPFFGKITGSAVVEAPVFYFTGVVEEDHWYGDYKMNVNQEPSEESIINFTGGAKPMAKFVTKDLGVEEFYKSEFNINLQIKTNRTGSIDKPGLNISVYTVNGNDMDSICKDSKEKIGAKNNFYSYEFSCYSDNPIDMTENPRFGVDLYGEEGIEYSLRTGHESNNKYSEMEVTAA
jgi:hypothetical protein